MWIIEMLTKRHAHHISDNGEQFVEKAKITARYNIFQISNNEHRIYYFLVTDGYYAIDFYSQNFSKNEEMFAEILASFEFLE